MRFCSSSSFWSAILAEAWLNSQGSGVCCLLGTIGTRWGTVSYATRAFTHAPCTTWILPTIQQHSQIPCLLSSASVLPCMPRASDPSHRDCQPDVRHGVLAGYIKSMLLLAKVGPVHGS